VVGVSSCLIGKASNRCSKGNDNLLKEFSSDNLDKIFDGHKRYVIPPYQRGYAWTVDEVEELLDDLEDVKDRDDEHFFGFMLTVSDPNAPDKAIKIIDGQQRLSTAMLFLICARNFFKRANTLNAQKYQATLDRKIHTSEYEAKPMFTMGRTNQNLFKEILLRVPIDRQILDALATNDSNEKLIAAYKKIRSRIAGYNVELVQDYLNTLFTKFVIIRYDYPDEQKAYGLFDLINNRGIRLTESDHIKNYIFGELEKFQNSDVMDEYDEIWTEMRENVTSKKQANYKTLDTFLIAYERYWKRNDKILFELVVMMCFKYHMRAKVISDISTNSYEDQMYKLTQGISKSLTASKLAQQIIALMEHVAYPPTDRIFKNLETMSITTARIAVIPIWNVDAILERNRDFARILCNELDLGRIANYLNNEYQNGVKPDTAL